MIIITFLSFVAGGAVHPFTRVTGGAIAISVAVVHVELVPFEADIAPGLSRGMALLALSPIMVARRIVAILAVTEPLVVESGAAPGSGVVAQSALPAEVVCRTRLGVAGLAVGETGGLVVHADIRPASVAAGDRRSVAC